MVRQTVDIDGTDFAAAAQNLTAGGFERIAEKRVKHALRQSANVVRGRVKAEASRHNRGRNRLAKGVHTTWKGAGMAFALRVSATGPVAHLIVGGVRPHIIRSHSRVMTVPYARGFATVVENRGFRGDPFVHRGITKSLPEIQGIVTAAGEAMVADLAKKLKGKKR